MNTKTPLVTALKWTVNRDCYYLILIIGLALFVRSWDIGWNGFNGDESIYSGQSASLLGDKDFLKEFAIFRAHPLLMQSLVSLSFAIFGISDVAARFVPVIFGTLTVFMTYLVGKELFDRKVGLVASLVLALLPFHIVFSRQVLLDVALSFFVMLFLYFIARHKKTKTNVFSFWIGVSCAFCFLSKEVGLITFPIFFIYSLLTRTLTVGRAVVFLTGFALTTLPYYLLLLTRQDAGDAFIQYSFFQLGREATIFSLRYSSIVVNEAFGYVLVILCIVSCYLIWRESGKKTDRKYRDHVLLLALVVGTIFLFFQLLPSKGDRFMITLVPPGVILGCSFLVLYNEKRRRMQALIFVILIPAIVLSNNFFLSKVFPIEDLKISDYLGTPWNRDVALWIKHNTSSDNGVLTSESKLANIIKFYANRDVYTIEINRNPSYVQVLNPLLLVLNKNATIIVEDLAPELYNTRVAIEMRKHLEFLRPQLVHTVFKPNSGDENSTPVPIVKIYRLN